MKDSFLEQKKINTLLYTNKLKKLLIYPNYIDYDKSKINGWKYERNRGW